MVERKYYRKTYQKKQGVFISFLKFLGFCFFFFVFVFLFLFIYYIKDLPRPENFTEREIFEPTKIYDRTGEILLYEIYGEERREWVPLKEIPKYLQEAVIATEDANFYKHSGIDIDGMVRAVLIDLRIKEPLYGGSTITQQLIRSTYLSTEKTIERKVKEIILALELERRYSKEEILEWYLNEIPFGRNSYGVERASRAYFGKSVSKISLGEAATLAALIKSPSFYSTEENFDELLGRRNYVLDRMAEERFLSEEDVKKAKEEEINIIKDIGKILAPHFTLWVNQQLEEKYGREYLEKSGLKVYTTLDWELQREAEEIVKKGVENNKIYNSYNGALTAINPKTGEVLAMVGSADYWGNPKPSGCNPNYPNCFESQNCCKFVPDFNVATQGLRQPGSALKPFIYVTAFKKGYTDKTIVNDSPTCWPDSGGEYWCPRNFDGLFRGPVTLRSALAQSLNIPSVKVLDELAGIKDSIKTAEEMGITTLNEPEKYGLSIVLGGAGVKLIDMVSAYSVFTSDGLRVPMSAILKIENSEGEIIFENNKTPIRVLEKRVARLINDILSDNTARAPMFGWQSNLYFEDYKIAAKTGTSQDSRDGWVLGYSTSLTTGVWVGNNDNSPMSKQAAELLAGPIFHQFMEKALLKYPPENFPK